jgi:hypothetical protein
MSLCLTSSGCPTRSEGRFASNIRTALHFESNVEVT